MAPTPPESTEDCVAGNTDGLHSSNHRVKRLRRLISQRKARSSERAFVVEGTSVVDEALTASVEHDLVVEGLYAGPEADAGVVARARELGLTVHHTAAGVLESVLDAVHPQPIAAVVAKPVATIDDLGVDGLILCMIEARDPGNVGTLIRSAEAAGAAGVVLAGSSVDPGNPKALRASAGAGLRLPVAVEPDIGRALDDLAATGRRLAATVIEPEAIPYDQVSLANTVIMLGNETHGLSPEAIERAELLVTIPLAGPTESLNLAVAGSVLCFEALRQRRLFEAENR